MERRIRKTDPQKLLLLMEYAWLDQGELAEKAGLHPATINKLCTGNERSPRKKTLEKIARALQVHPEELLEEPEPQPVRQVRPYPTDNGSLQEAADGDGHRSSERSGYGATWDHVTGAKLPGGSAPVVVEEG